MGRFYTRRGPKLHLSVPARARSVSVAVVAVVFVSGCSSSLRSVFGPPDDEITRSRVERPGVSPGPAAPTRTARSITKPQAPLMRPLIPVPIVSIAGLREDDVRRVMGEPQETSDRDGRKIWIYRGAGCRVEVTFFRDVTRDTYAALAHKVVRTDGGEEIGAACLRGVRSAARP